MASHKPPSSLFETSPNPFRKRPIINFWTLDVLKLGRWKSPETLNVKISRSGNSEAYTLVDVYVKKFFWIYGADITLN